MSVEKSGVIIDLDYEGRKTRFRLPEVPSCRNYTQLLLTGKVYESYPRQFEVKCTCGCGYSGMAYMTEEEKQMNRLH